MKLYIWFFATVLAATCYAIEEPVITDTTHPRATLAPLSGLQGFSKDVRVYVRENGQPYALSTNSKVLFYYATNLASIYVGVSTNVSINTNTESALIQTLPLPAGNYRYAVALAESGRTNDLGTGVLTVPASSFLGGFAPLPGQTIDWSTLIWTGSNQPVKSGTVTINGYPVTNNATINVSVTSSVASVFARVGNVTAQAGDYTAAQVGAVATNDERYLASVTNGGATINGSAISNGAAITITESDPLWSAVSNAYLLNWNTAFGWGDHSTNGYLKTYSETDPVWSAVSNQYLRANGSVAWNGNENAALNSLTNLYQLVFGEGGSQTFNISSKYGDFNLAYDRSTGLMTWQILTNATALVYDSASNFQFNAFVNPYTSNTWTLGTMAKPWSDLHFGNSVSLNSKLTVLDNADTWSSNNVVQALANTLQSSNAIVVLDNARIQVSNNVVNASNTASQAIANSTYNSNNMHNASALTNQLWAVSINYAVATNGANFTNSIGWIYAPKAGTITNIVADGVEGICRAGLWIRSNGVPPTANSYIAYTNIPSVAGTSSNILMTVPYNAGVFIGVPVTNGSASNVTFTVVGVE